MKIYLQPQPQQFPERGGVRTHLLQIEKYLKPYLTPSLVEADIYHVESAWPIPHPKKPTVYVCHGGFLPNPLPVVLSNLAQADRIISVAGWMIDRFFPEYLSKTVIIPNGVSHRDFEDIPSSNLPPGYVLYAKEWDYWSDDLIYLATKNPDRLFVTTIWPSRSLKPENVKVIGLQDSFNIKRYVKDAGCLLLTGSEVCPTMLLEAWSLGVPVLAKNIDGSREIMLRGNTVEGGCLYDDREDIQLKLDLVLSNQEHYGDEGYGIVMNEYQWSDLIEEYFEVYGEIF